MVGFIEAVPVEIEQAAMIDGCSVLGALVRIVVPLTRQGIAATAILAFIASWNNFLFALVLSNEQTKTLPVAVLGYIGYNSIQWGSLMATRLCYHLAGAGAGAVRAALHRARPGQRRGHRMIGLALPHVLHTEISAITPFYCISARDKCRGPARSCLL
jgi:ABC-type spermidine/putrescine transport system permease subunit II